MVIATSVVACASYWNFRREIQDELPAVGSRLVILEIESQICVRFGGKVAE